MGKTWRRAKNYWDDDSHDNRKKKSKKKEKKLRRKNNKQQFLDSYSDTSDSRSRRHL